MLLRHPEYHFGQSDAVKDVVIGAADGLTVPFALAAGLAGAVAGANIVVTAGLAEIAAGAIAMGLAATSRPNPSATISSRSIGVSAARSTKSPKRSVTRSPGSFSPTASQEPTLTA